jgi:hypothetical protein
MTAQEAQIKIDELAPAAAAALKAYAKANAADTAAVYAKYGSDAGEFKNIPASAETAALLVAYVNLRDELRRLEAIKKAAPKAPAKLWNPWDVIHGI